MGIEAGRQVARRAVVASSTHEGTGIGRWQVLPVKCSRSVGSVVTSTTHCGCVGDVGLGSLGVMNEVWGKRPKNAKQEDLMWFFDAVDEMETEAGRM